MRNSLATFAGRWLGLAVSVLFLAASDARADKRVALVVGNGAYQKVPALPNPANDAADIAASLERLGFAVRRLNDATFEHMRRGLIEFGRQARDADIAVMFFAGHGMEIGGENWLFPIDAELRSDTDAENETVSLRTAMLQVANARNLGLVILDACRNNPFAAKMKRSIRTRAVERGLVRTEPTDNVLVAYAAKDGTTANDGTGRNSPFSSALLNNIEKPGLEVTFIFRNVRDEVMAATKREQQPFVYGSLSKEAIYLKEPLAISRPSAAPAAPSEPDEVLWETIRELNVAGLFKEFLRRFPKSPRAADARRRLAEASKTPEQQVAVLSPAHPRVTSPAGEVDKSKPPVNEPRPAPGGTEQPPIRTKSERALSTGFPMNGTWFVKQDCDRGKFEIELSLKHTSASEFSGSSVGRTTGQKSQITGGRVRGSSVTFTRQAGGLTDQWGARLSGPGRFSGTSTGPAWQCRYTAVRR